MKKILVSILLVVLITLTGCTKVEGLYKEGTHFAYDEETQYTVIVYVDESGLIKSVFFDAPYIVYDSDNKCPEVIKYGKPQCQPTTKQILKDEYGMRAASSIDKEWYEQVEAFADKVIKEQNLDWLTFKYKDADENIVVEQPEGKTEADKVYTDSVSGVTIRVDNLYRLIDKVIKQAKAK